MRKMRRTYVQPTSEVVRLHVTNQLLAGSGGQDVQGLCGSRDGYGNGNSSVEEGEKDGQGNWLWD